LGTVVLKISCELVFLMAILNCVYFYGMKSDSGSLYGVCTLLYCKCNVDKLNWCIWERLGFTDAVFECVK